MSEDLNKNSETESRIKIISKEDKKNGFLKRFKYLLGIIGLMVLTSLLTILLYRVTDNKKISTVGEIKNADSEGFFIQNTEDQIRKIVSEKYGQTIGVAVNKDDFFFNDFNKVTSGLLLNDKGDILVPLRIIPEGVTDVYIRVSTNDKGSVYSAKVKGTDMLTGVTLINSPNLSVKVPELVTQDKVSLGKSIVLIASPFGDPNLVNMGYGRIHAANNEYNIKDSAGQDNKVNIILSNIGAYNGNDGSMVVDTEGRVLGVVSYYLSDKLGLRGNSAIISNVEINRIVNRINGNTESRSFALGVEGKVITYDKLGKQVFYVLSVKANSTAQKGGLLPTDLILEIDKVPVGPDFSQENILSKKKVGDIVTVKIYRENEEKTLVMKVY